jgi:anti-anti-sigma factor
VSDIVTLTLDASDDVVIAKMAGELDLSNAPSTGEEIAAGVPNTARALVVDLSALDFLDSSGVSMLFRLARRLGGRRQQLHVVAPTGAAVARVLEIVEFGRAAPLHTTLDGALAATQA